MRTAHTVCPTGQRVRVTLKNGESFVEKFKEAKGTLRIFEHRRVRQGDILTFTIVKGNPA